jgi:hypothetical protein
MNIFLWGYAGESRVAEAAAAAMAATMADVQMVPGTAPKSVITKSRFLIPQHHQSEEKKNRRKILKMKRRREKRNTTIQCN